MTRKAQEPTEITAMAFARFLARGLNRQDAATYVGVSATHFDAMVRDGLMPQPKVSGARVIWDRAKLDAFFAALPDRGDEAAGNSFADWQ
jgi:predicted DNA-binding transcriptional regulator AlpA